MPSEIEYPWLERRDLEVTYDGYEFELLTKGLVVRARGAKGLAYQGNRVLRPKFARSLNSAMIRELCREARLDYEQSQWNPEPAWGSS